MQVNPYEPPTQEVSGKPTRSHWNSLPLARVFAILVGLYAIVPLLYGGVGLALIPGILAGGVSFPRGTPSVMYLWFARLNLVLAAHGCIMLAVATNLWKARWRRAFGMAAMAVILGALAANLFISSKVAGSGTRRARPLPVQSRSQLLYDSQCGAA